MRREVGDRDRGVPVPNGCPECQLNQQQPDEDQRQDAHAVGGVGPHPSAREADPGLAGGRSDQHRHAKDDLPENAVKQRQFGGDQVHPSRAHRALGDNHQQQPHAQPHQPRPGLVLREDQAEGHDDGPDAHHGADQAVRVFPAGADVVPPDFQGCQDRPVAERGPAIGHGQTGVEARHIATDGDQQEHHEHQQHRGQMQPQAIPGRDPVVAGGFGGVDEGHDGSRGIIDLRRRPRLPPRPALGKGRPAG